MLYNNYYNKALMRNHKLVNDVIDKMLEYNHQFYIDDIIELSTSRQYNNNINNYLTQIANILNSHLNSNNQANSNYIIGLRSSLKSYIYMILDNFNGTECCNKLMCINL